MAVRAVALLGPGLDGQLAIALLQRQGVEVVATTLVSAFTSGLDAIERAAGRLHVPLHVVVADDEYYERVRHPRHGYTREMEPGLDLKIYQQRAAGQLLALPGATCVVTGDVVGQRLPGQSKRDLALVDIHSGLEGQVLRPLSAHLLPTTAVETSGLVDRAALLSLQGRGRQSQLKLAGELGWLDIPAVTSGTLLADVAFARKLQDLLAHNQDANEQDFALLRLGKHYRLADRTKVIVGRNAVENGQLQSWPQQHPLRAAECLSPEGFVGPSALVIGEMDEETRLLVARLVWQARKKSEAPSDQVTFGVASQGETRRWEVASADLEHGATSTLTVI